MPALLTYRDAMRVLTVSRMTIWRLIRDGAMPAPVQVSPHRVAFLASDIQTYIETRGRA